MTNIRAEKVKPYNQLKEEEDAEAQQRASCWSMAAMILRKAFTRMPSSIERPGATQARPTQHSASSRLFGLRSAKSKEALSEASLSRLNGLMSDVEAKILSAQSKVEEEERSARLAYQKGDKALALRLLKKSKLSGRRLAALNATLSSIAAQADALETAALQTELVSALSTSNSVLKKTFGGKGRASLVSNAESAADDAAEARDALDDLQAALAEVGASSADADDDELLEELEGMASTEITGRDALREATRIAAERRANVADAASFPSAPTSQPLQVEEVAVTVGSGAV